jgi:hypothetical protein
MTSPSPFSAGEGLSGLMATRSVNNPGHWLERAAEMRALADAMQDAETTRSMKRLAEEYERLADRAALRSDGQVPPGAL